jgi:hypothetical protein
MENNNNNNNIIIIIIIIIIISIFKNEFIFWKKIIIGFVNVETDPRLR